MSFDSLGELRASKKTYIAHGLSSTSRLLPIRHYLLSAPSIPSSFMSSLVFHLFWRPLKTIQVPASWCLSLLTIRALATYIYFPHFCIRTPVWPVLFQSSSFMILTGKNISSILFRRTNTMNSFEFLQLFKVSHPYKSKELTWVSNIVIILHRLICWDFHMYQSCAKVLILYYTSSSAPVSSIPRLPRYLKLSTLSTMSLFIFEDDSLFNYLLTIRSHMLNNDFSLIYCCYNVTPQYVNNCPLNTNFQLSEAGYNFVYLAFCWRNQTPYKKRAIGKMYLITYF